VPTNEPDKYSVTCKVCKDVKKVKKPKNYKWQKNDGTDTMSRHLRSEHGLEWKARRGAAVADKFNYTVSVKSSNYEYFNKVALQPQYRKVKWCAYLTEFLHIYVIAAILDRGVKLEGLTNLLTFYYQQLDVQFDVLCYVNNCKRILERLCEDYGALIQPQPVGSSMGASRFGILGPILKKSRPDGGGKNHSSKFLVLARIAKDILAIPASTITSESALVQ
ncbi:putative AC transposase, partial [Bienertia sinuspersici]